MGVFSELDLENQQTELDGHDSKAAEMQTLQAKLIQQHEQKKAAAAAEKPNTEPAANALPQRSCVRADGHAPKKEHGALPAIHQPEGAGISACGNEG